MSKLDSIQRGKIHLPPRLVVYGTEKIGKTTLAAGAPKPIILQTESGSNEINCERFPLATTFGDVIESLSILATQAHEYQTIVIDSLDWLERLVHEATCAKFGVTHIEKVDGGYGKGYVHALVFWRDVLSALDYLRAEKMMCVVCIAHSKVEKFEDPECSTAIDRFGLKLNKHAAALVAEWSDAIVFATRKMIVKTVESGFNKSRSTAQGLGHDGGERILRCTGGPSCVAGNRYGLAAELPLSWPVLYQQIIESQTK